MDQHDVRIKRKGSHRGQRMTYYAQCWSRDCTWTMPASPSGKCAPESGFATRQQAEVFAHLHRFNIGNPEPSR